MGIDKNPRLRRKRITLLRKVQLLLASASYDRLLVEQERLVVRIPKRQKDWLKQQATEFKTISDVVRELIDRQIETTSASRDNA